MNRQQQLDNIRNRGRGKAASNGQAAAASPPPPPTPKVANLAYYDANKGQFWTRNSRSEWIQFSEASLRRLLKYNHYHAITDKDAQFAMIDKKLLAMQHEDDVSYAGSIAGYRSGVQTVCGQRVLITSGPRLLRPAEGRWDRLREFMEQLLGEHVRIFYGWIKSALRSLYAGPPWRPGQMLAIAGPPGCGKSLLQNLITEMLGNRSGKPYRYMTGDTSFNGELLQCEHLMIEDEAASTDIRIRRTFGSQLKNMIVNEVQSMHRKGRDALSVTPFWRLSISLNDEPENLMVLPPIDDSLRDKLTLLRGHPFTPPYAADDIPARNEWRGRLSAELPAFMHWLRNWRVPPSMLNVRYGVRAFQDPNLLHELHCTSPESELLDLIDSCRIWGVDNEPFEGTANELKERLLEKDKHGRAHRLLYFSNACSAYLNRLAAKIPNRVSARKEGRSSTLFRVLPPDK